MNLLGKYLPLTLPSLFLLAGCAALQQKELSLSHSSKLRNATIACIEREFPNLEVYSTADAGGGGPFTFLVGALLVPGYTDDPDDTEINNQIQKSDIGNPNKLFQTEILNHLANFYGMSEVDSTRIIPNKNGNFILDTSVRWRAAYLPMKMTRFRFHMDFDVQINDATGIVFFRDKFSWRTPSELGFPAMGQFLNNSEIGIEAQLHAAIAEALEYYKAKLN